MDIGTVSERLGKNHYARLEDFANETRLIWKNAFIFNAPDSLYFKAAKSLSDAFEKAMEKMEAEVRGPAAAIAAPQMSPSQPSSSARLPARPPHPRPSPPLAQPPR